MESSLRDGLRGPRRRRATAATGIVAVALLLPGGILMGSAGGPTRASPQVVAEHLVRNEGQLFLGAWLVGLSATTLLCFAASLRNALHRAEGGTGGVPGVAFGAGVIVALMLMLGAIFTIVAFQLVATLDDPVAARAFLAVSPEIFHGTALPLALFVGAASLVGVRMRALPLWLAWPGLVVGLVVVASWVVYPIWFFGLHLSLLWVVIASVTLLRRAEPIEGTDTRMSERERERSR